VEINLIFKGVIVGLLVSAPLGPIGILCIQRTLNRGRISGFISGIGAAVADTIFAIVASLGLSIIINFIQKQHMYLQILGGLFVLYIGARIFYTNPFKQLKLQRLGKTSLSHDFFSVLLLTLSNPIAIFLFLAIMAGINIADTNLSVFEFLILLAGIFGGAVLWWFLLSTLANRFRKLIRLRNIWWLNKITGSLIFLFGLAVIISVWIL
jgi:threonine/homoserine/homoserine lactone efflux protein